MFIILFYNKPVFPLCIRIDSSEMSYLVYETTLYKQSKHFHIWIERHSFHTFGLYHRIISFYSDGVIMSRKLNQSYHEEKIIFQIDSNSTIRDKYSPYWGVVRRCRYNIKKYTLEIRNSKNQSILFKLKDRQSLALLTDKIKVMMCNMRIDMISKKNELRNELLMEAAGQSSSEQEKDDSQYSASQLQRDYRYNQSTKQSYNISPTLLKAKKMKAETRCRCL